ncbi:MAG: hypothetical protein ACPLXO_03155, partial [Desulfurella sp.]
MKKYFFSIVLFLFAINYSYAFQKATNIDSLTFEHNICTIKGNGYMFYKTFTLDKDNNKLLVLDILGIKSFSKDIPTLILAKDSSAVSLVKLELHKDKDIGLRVVFTINKETVYQIDRNNNTITVAFSESSIQQANNDIKNPKLQTLSQETTKMEMKPSNGGPVLSSNENNLRNTIESISAGAFKDKTQVSITTTKKPVYEVKYENGNILVVVKDVGPSKPAISNTSKLVEKITTNIEKNNYGIKVFTNNAHIDAISSTDKSIFIVLSPQEAVEDLNIISKEERTSFTGKKISFDVRDADLQDVLRVIAAAANLNVMIGDSVKGKITMRLMNIPWDEALDLIAKQQGLVVQRQGNVLLINSASEAAKLTKEQLEAITMQQNLERKNDAVAKIIKLNYI